MIEMNICLSSDNNYAPYMGTAIASILKNNLEYKKIIFHLTDGVITKENKDKILLLKNIKEYEINFYNSDIKMYDEWFEKFFVKHIFFCYVLQTFDIKYYNINIIFIL